MCKNITVSYQIFRYCSFLIIVMSMCIVTSTISTKTYAKSNAKAKAFITDRIKNKKPVKKKYIIKYGKKTLRVSAKKVTVISNKKKKKKTIKVNGKSYKTRKKVIVRVAGSKNHNPQKPNHQNQSSSSATVSDLPGGGSRTIITFDDGSSHDTVSDPHGGKNGGSRVTIGNTDSEGNMTVTTIITDGANGLVTTTTTYIPN